LWTPPQTNGGAQRQRQPASKFGQLNERAIANLDKWVLKLFPTAKEIRLGYPVPSADLGRGREEDLSLTSKSIKYFGDADMGDLYGGRRTAIDTVMEWNHIDHARRRALARTDAGKSFWTYDAVMHIVLGWEYRGRRVQQGSAIYTSPSRAATALPAGSTAGGSAISPRIISRYRFI
jgi:hypothetical protein